MSCALFHVSYIYLSNLMFAQRNSHSNPILFRSTSLHRKTQTREMDIDPGDRLHYFVFGWNVFLRYFFQQCSQLVK